MSTNIKHMVLTTEKMKCPIQTPIADLAQEPGSPQIKKDAEAKTIHSGHFMISRVHDSRSGSYLSDEEDEANDDQDNKMGFNFENASKSTLDTYQFGPKSTQTLAIDASLSKLFDHMTLAYSGKITSPKWKQFRGMHLKVKDKIRLNNMIWREWHMQYIYGMKSHVCQFATPLYTDDVTHTKPEAIVLEGYYWKRRLDTITEEYKEWRNFFKEQRLRHLDKRLDITSDDPKHHELLQKVGEVQGLSSFPKRQQTSSTDLLLNSRDFQDMMDLSDNLFSNLNQPFAFPNQRELSGFGYGDFIQPSLLQFQPNLDEFMELDHMEMFNTSKFGNSTNSSNSASLINSDVVMGSTSHLGASPQPQMCASPSPQMALSPAAPLTPGSTSLLDSPQASPSPGNPETQMLVDNENYILSLLQSQQKQLEQKSQQQKRLQQQQLQQQQQQQQQLRQQQQLLQQQQLQQKKQEQELQQKQQQQQQQQQQRQQQQLQQEQIALLLQQNTQLKNLLQQSNATSLIEELSKSIQLAQSQDQTQSPSRTQSLTPTLTQTQIRTPTPTQNQTSVNDSFLAGLFNVNNTNLQQPSQTHTAGVGANLNLKPKKQNKSVKIGILEALKADENQIALNRSTSNQQSQTNSLNQSNKQTLLGGTSIPKKDTAGFTIPMLPLSGRGRGSKQRVIAPAPTATVTTPQSSLTQQNSYLAQLLTTGTYPGAIISVKEEHPTGQFSAIQPSSNVTSQSTTQSSSSASIAIPMITDFPTSVLLAAANHAFSPSPISVKEVFHNVSKQGSFTANSPMMVASSVKPEVAVASPSSSFNLSTMVSSPGAASSPSSSSFDDSLIPAVAFMENVKSPEADYSEMQIEEKGDVKLPLNLSAEKKRRCNIKSPGQTQKGGFDLLNTLIPSLSQNPNAKVSKAAMLQKTAEYCKKLKLERSQMQKEADILKQEIGSLNQAISICQSQLPATGVPVTRQRADQMKEMFEEYVKQRTLTNWKFWIFSIIIRNLFDSFNTMVSTASVDELCRTVLAWLDQHCSLPSLRPIAMDAMRRLSTTTSILSDPTKVPEQAAQAVIKKRCNSGGS